MTSVCCRWILLGCVWPLAAQPVIAPNGVMNAASYGAIGPPGSGIAPGSLFVIFGTGLGPATLQQAQAYPLGTALAATSVRIGETPAYLVYTSATQVAAIAPSALRPGTYPVTVTFNNQTSGAVSIPVVTTDFGVFTRNAAGYGQAAAQTVILPEGSVQTLGLAASVRSGEPVVLYGTGLGAIAGAADDQAPGARRTTVTVEVAVGGRVLAPDYAGRSPAFAGLDQINFTLPFELGTGCYIPVGVRANGRLSNVVSIPVARAGRDCDHPFRLSRDILQRLDLNGTAFVALSIMERNKSASGGSEGAGIGFAEMDPNDIEAFVNPVSDPYDASGTPGTCVPRNVDQNLTVPTRPRVSRPRFLDAGATVRLEGPAFSMELRRTPLSGYGENLAGGPGMPAAVLREGTWTFSGSGGSEIGAFRLAVALAEPLTWTNPQTSVDPAQALRIEWTGGGSDPVQIQGSAGMQGPSGITFGSFICTARAEDGSLTIPREMVASLPLGGTGAIVLSQRVRRSGFDVPLARGGPVDGTQFLLTDQTSGSIRVQAP
jgi:uncharacterized protein (TIGR03437 family)